MSSSDSFFKKLFDPSGRSGRIDFLLGWLASIVLSIILVGIYTGIVNSIRRWHDLGRSGWLTLLLLIPFLGPFIFLYLLFAPGREPGEANVNPLSF